MVFTVSTGQAYGDQDRPDGYKIYEEMLKLDPSFFVHTGDIVYSTKKRIDVGTNGRDGPYAVNGLGPALDQLSTVAVGDAAAALAIQADGVHLVQSASTNSRSTTPIAPSASTSHGQ